MAEEVERLVFIVEVKDSGSADALNGVAKKAKQTAETIGVSFKQASKMVDDLFKTSIGNNSGTLDEMNRRLKDLWGEDFYNRIMKARDATQKVNDTFKDLNAMVQTSSPGIDRLKESFSELFQKIKDFDFSGWVVNGFVAIGEAALGLAGTLLDSLVKVFVKLGETIKEVTVDSIKAYADFEEQMLGARRTMDLTDESVRELMKHTQQLALNFEEGGLKAGTTTATLAEIEGIAGQMNITFEDGAERFDNFVTTVAKAAGAFQISADATASALGIISTIFDVPIEKANELAGGIATVGNASVGTVPQILDYVQRIGAAGVQMGLTANQAIALGGMFREAGVPIEVAGTATVNIFTKMRTELDRFAESLAAGGLTKQMLETALRSGDAAGAIEMVVNAIKKINDADPFAGAQAMKDLGIEGSRSTLVLNSLVAQFGKFKEFAAMIEDPMNNIKALNDAYEASLKGLNKQWDATKNILTVIAQIIGEKLSMALANVLEKYINPFMLKFAEWIQNSPVAQAILTELGRTIEIIGAGFGKLLEKFIAWLNSLDTLEGQKGVHDWFAKLHTQIEKLMTTGFGELQKAAENLWKFLTTTNWGNVWRETVATLTTIKEIILSLKKTTEDLGIAWDIFKMTLEEISKDVGVVLVPIFESIANYILHAKDEAEKFKQMISDIIEVVGFLGKALADGVGNAFDGVMGKLKGLADLAYKHSVFPDMVDWAGKTADAVGSISSQTTALVSSLAVVGQATNGVAASWDNVAAGARNALTYAGGVAATWDSITSAQQRVTDLAMNMWGRGGSTPAQFARRQEQLRIAQEELARARASQNILPVGENISSGMGGAVPSGASPGGFGSGAGNGGGGSMWAQPQNQVVTPSAAAPVILTINAGANLLDEYTLSNFALQIEQSINETRGRTVRRIG